MATTLLAMVKTGSTTFECRKVLSTDADIFRLPDNLTASHDYNPGAVLEDDSWFGLPHFKEKSYCLTLLQQEPFSSVDYDAITKGDFGKIVFLCGYQSNMFYFQRVTPARQINQKRIIFGEQCRYEENSASISLSYYADAVYDPNENKLYFRKLRDISAIFHGIDELYREATRGEVINFLGYSFVELSDGFTSDNVGTYNRKRIAQSLEILSRFSVAERETVFDYIKDYCPTLANANNKFIVNSEDSLKRLLYGIEQRYYTTPVGEERRLANSVIALNQQGGQSQ